MVPRKRAAGEEEPGISPKKPRPERSDSIVAEGKDPDIVMTGDSSPPAVEIDEDLHSRQLAVYGRETMRRLVGANILISGLKGLGVEIAKNMILTGVKSVMLHDTGTVELWDLSAQFYFSESDIGKNRALACVEKLQELNTSVSVSTFTSEVTVDLLSRFQAAIFTNATINDAIKYNEYCRNCKPSIAFIKADIHGLFGSAFCDFGPEFTVFDVDGEEPHTGIIGAISNDIPAAVSCVDDESFKFQDGDFVVFSEIQGMTELNDGQPRKIKNCEPYHFFLEADTSGFGSYKKGGIVTQFKQPKVLNFKPLREALSNPVNFLHCDSSKVNRPQLLHLAFQALDAFQEELGRLPIPASCEDSKKLIECAKAINENAGELMLENLDELVLNQFANGARAVLNPMAAMLGGIVGQEVLKACSGKFHPLFQFFYFDSLESLPLERLQPEDITPLNSRYDAQISVFGRKMQQKLQDTKVFIVGAGALGCEFVKNLALMGVSCGKKGKTIISDNNVIKKSDLSQQFLFRERNIGQVKSTVAASAALAINPSQRLESLHFRVCAETDTVFDDTFWKNTDIVISALDNLTSRLYVDSRCIYFKKPLLKSGTLGTKCNTQTVVPYLTENYRVSMDPAEKEVPMCTRNYPQNIDHCLTWARYEFENLFEKIPEETNAFLSNPKDYRASMKSAGHEKARELLKQIAKTLLTDQSVTFEDCMHWARKRFEDYFVNHVKQLTLTFPENTITNAGALFWAAPKRFPKPLKFTSSDPAHLSFIAAASILRAKTFRISVPDWALSSSKKLAEEVEKIELSDFQSKVQQEVKIETDEKDMTLNTSTLSDSSTIDEINKKLDEGVRHLPPGFCMNPIRLEKDDVTNYHMDLIAGLANMRARNYGIQEVDKLKAKLIAGRITPAIVTTTALATGLTCLELYKVLAGLTVDRYRNMFGNLALPLLSMSEPVPPKILKHGDLSWCLWDRWVIEKNLTMREFLEWFEAKELYVYSVSCQKILIFCQIFPKHRDRLDRKLVDLVRDVGKLNTPPNCRHFDLLVVCEDGKKNNVDVPLVTINF